MLQSLIFLILVTVVLAATPDGDTTPGSRKSPTKSVETVAKEPKRLKFGDENTTTAHPAAELALGSGGSAFGGPMRRLDDLSPTDFARSLPGASGSCQRSLGRCWYGFLRFSAPL